MSQPQFANGEWIDPPGGLIDTCLNGVTRLRAVASLDRVTGGHDTDDETCRWVEYRLAGEVVHRSVDLKLKTAVFADGFTANFS